MSKPKYSTTIQLVYRKYARQLEDSELSFEDIRRELSDVEPIRSQFGEMDEVYWPIELSKVSEYEARGILVVESGNTRSIIVRELPITVLTDSYEDAERRLDKILEKFPNSFAVIQVLRNYLTEVFAE